MNDALDVIGDRYSLAILREIVYGFRRFSDLATLTGAPRTVLTARLRKLEDAHVIERRQYSEHPPRSEYHLTAAGADLVPIMIQVKDWGENHAGDGEIKALFRHECGADLRPVTVCASCGEPLQPGQFTVAGGTHPPTIRA